ncbi:MAG: transglycosylase SLT domain-containing protein [bacterium]
MPKNKKIILISAILLAGVSATAVSLLFHLRLKHEPVLVLAEGTPGYELSCPQKVAALLESFVVDEVIELLNNCEEAKGDYRLREAVREAAAVVDFNNAAGDEAYPYTEKWLDGGKRSEKKATAVKSPEGITDARLKTVIAFRRAFALYNRGDYRSSRKILDEMAENDILGDYRLHLTALVSMRLGNYQGVERTAAAFIGKYPNSLLYDEMKLALAAAHHKQGKKSDAIKEIEEILDGTASPTAKGRALALAAAIHRAEGREAQTRTALMRIPTMYPSADFEKDGIKNLIDAAKSEIKNSKPETIVKVAEFLFEKKMYFSAAEYLKKALKAHSQHPSLTLLIGKVEYARGKQTEAARHFSAIIARSAGSEVHREAHLWRARSLHAAKKYSEAEKEYLRTYQDYDNFQYLPLQDLIRMYEETGDEKKYYIALEMLLKKFPNLEGNDVHLRMTGRKNYLEGRRSEALSAYQTLIRDFPQSGLSGLAYFWSGKIMLEMGLESEAHRHFEEIEKRFPYSYFCVRAEELTSSGVRDCIEKGQRDYTAMINSLSSDMHLRNGYALMASGLLEAARVEFEAAGNAREAAVGLSKFYRLIGHNPLSVKAIEKAVEKDGEFFRTVLGSAVLTELLFPLHYRQEISSVAREFGVDPALMFALIRQESRFDPHALSSSNAMGLTQILPSTGVWISEKMGIGAFRASALYDVKVNVRMGAWYLRYLIDKFGDVPSALAAYNWGEGNLRRWKERFPSGDADRFFESVPRAETRRYVGNVLFNYQVYKNLDYKR